MLPLAEIGKVFAASHETLVENEVVCSQSTLVGVSDHVIVAGDELTSPLKCIASVSGPFVYVAAAAIGAHRRL